MTVGTDAMSGDRPLRVRLLSGFAVEGLDEKALGTRKARLLLKRLAVETGRPVSTDQLVAVLWPAEVPKRPAEQVSVLVSRLRSTLGATRLPRSDAGYRLQADWYDVVELEQRVAELEERLGLGERASALAAAQAALALASGGLLPEEDGEWVDERRPGVERLVARARVLAGEAAFAAGEYGAARAAAQSVLDVDPYDEAALRIIMKSDALTGKPGAALAAYAVVRHRLSEDLGADPSTPTEELHTAIVRGELAAATDGTSVPGTGAVALVGRDMELGLLDAMLARASEGDAIATVVEAETGMGKSTLLSTWTSRHTLPAFVMAGRCDELGRDLPLQPIADALAAHLDGLGRHAAGDLLGAEALILAPLLGQGLTGVPPGPTTVTDLESGRSTLFTALATVVRRAAGERPLVLLVDDLHQAAPGTAEFLAFCLRRMTKLMVVAARRPEPGPDLPDARRIVLGPLSLAETVALVGPERGPALYERSGGHPLFLHELAAGTGDELPDSLIAAIRARLGPPSNVVIDIEVAASCGTEVDTALVAAISGRPVAAVLDGIEEAARRGLLKPRGAALAFSHELVREAIEAGTSAPRRTEIHRAAVAELARRPETDPLALARHARLGGNAAVAAAAMVVAAEAAKDRFEGETAETLLDQAVDLCDSSQARLARARLRLGRLDLRAAREDAERAMQLGAGTEGFELAGWVAYYGRDYDTALRYAEEGVERADEVGVRASCLALSGRIRHTRGQLADAAVRLQEGVKIAPAGIRGMVQVWHAQLLAHCGELDRAVDEARRGVLDPHQAHPFAWGHGRFTLAYAYGVAGKWAEAMSAVDELDVMVARQDDKRFPPVAANMRGWLLRGAGMLDHARELHHFAAESEPGPTFQEARYAGLLDLADCHLAGGDLHAASAATEAAQGVLQWEGSMSWRHRNRYRLAAARLAALDGDHLGAATEVRSVAEEAGARGDRRYQHRALVLASAIEARSGIEVDVAWLSRLVDGFVPLSGPDGWRDLAELAAATGFVEVWRQAEKHAATVVAQAATRPDFDSTATGVAVRRQLDAMRP